MMYTVARLYFAVARKMIALTAVIACVKLKTSVARIAGRSSGTTMCVSVRSVDARSVADASSSVLSIWARAATPARTPTGMLRNTKHSTRIAMPPVSSSGGTLKATIYDTPMTVPGIAKLTKVRNSKGRRPTNRCRAITYAASKPIIAVSGAEIAATVRVVNRLSHAEPLKNTPRGPHSAPNPAAKWPSDKVMSPRPMSLTKPPTRMTA